MCCDSVCHRLWIASGENAESVCCSPRDDSSRDRLVDVYLFFGSAAMGVESDIWNLSERSQCGAVDCSRSNIGVSKIVHVFTKCSDKLGAG